MKKLEQLDFWKSLAIIVVILSGYLAYQKMVAIPNARLEEQKRVEERKQLDKANAGWDYEYCLSSAFSQYKADWNYACSKDGQGKDCMLAGYQADAIEENHDDAKKLCLKVYQAKI